MTEGQTLNNIDETLELAIKHHQEGRLEQAKNLYDKILANNATAPEVLLLRGTLAVQEGEYKLAFDHLSNAIRIRSNSAETYNALGLAEEGSGNLKNAVDSFRKAIDLKSDFVEAYNNLGNTLRSLKMVEEALESYSSAIKIDPEFSLAHYNHANLLRENGRPTEAIPYYQQAIRIDPGHFLFYNNLGLAWQETGKLEEALSCYNRSIELNSNFGEAYFNQHSLLMDHTDLTRAIESMRQAVLIDAQRMGYRLMLGILLDYSGHIEESKAHLSMIAKEDIMGQAMLDSWDYMKHQNETIPPILGSSIDTFKMALRAATLDGLCLEFGVRFGTSIRQLGPLIKETIHGFDSFMGLPEQWHDQPKGSYDTGGSIPSVPTNVTLYKGWFNETVPDFLLSHTEPIRFVNIDCDTYNSTKTILDLTAKRIIPGTVLVFDEFICNRYWREDEFKAFKEAATRYCWKYKYICFSLMTKQVAVQII